MGNLQASEMAGFAAEGAVQLDMALSWHLQSNHYPPVNSAFIPVCKQAIELANQGEWDAVLTYPNGLERTVAYTIEGLHLDAFLDQNDYEEE